MIEARESQTAHAKKELKLARDAELERNTQLVEARRDADDGTGRPTKTSGAVSL